MHWSAQNYKHDAFEYLFILSPPCHSAAADGSTSISLAATLRDKRKNNRVPFKRESFQKMAEY